MGGGPNPKAVLVVSSKKYELSQILNSIDLIENTLDKRINKKLETIKIGDSAIQRYSYYEAAYWYPKDSSDIYGVAIVKWDTKGQGNGEDNKDNRYFIDVYAKEQKCTLCLEVESTLTSNGIEFFSECEKST